MVPEVEARDAADAALDKLFTWTMHVPSPEGYFRVVKAVEGDALDQLPDRIASRLDAAAKRRDVAAPRYRAADEAAEERRRQSESAAAPE